MPEQKTVYFASDGSGKWFDTLALCVEYEKKQEIKTYLTAQGATVPEDVMKKIVNALMKRYTMQQRADYVP